MQKVGDRDPLSAIAEVLGRLEERTGNIQQSIGEIERYQGEQNGRISALEKWQQRIVGGTVLLGLMSPLFIFGARESIAGIFR